VLEDKYHNTVASKLKTRS